MSNSAAAICHIPDEFPCPAGRVFWSLLDMIRYQVRDLHGLLTWLDHTVRFTYSQENHRQGESALLNPSEKNTTKLQVSCIRKHFLQLELGDSLPAIDGLLVGVDTMGLAELRGHLLGVRAILTDALEKRVFMYIPQEVSRYAKPFEMPIGQSLRLTASHRIKSEAAPVFPWVKPFGDKVFDIFENARYDAEQVALCLASGACTASVFHMMRVVEWGIRALGAHLGLRRIKSTSHPKPGGTVRKATVKWTPIENCTWESVHDQIRAKITKQITKLRPGPSKDHKHAVYGSLLEDFQGFKDAWRNHVMHTRLEIQDLRIALVVFGHVERFMTTMAVQI